jgi:hypothetical protein
MQHCVTGSCYHLGGTSGLPYKDEGRMCSVIDNSRIRHFMFPRVVSMMHLSIKIQCTDWTSPWRRVCSGRALKIRVFQVNITWRHLEASEWDYLL